MLGDQYGAPYSLAIGPYGTVLALSWQADARKTWLVALQSEVGRVLRCGAPTRVCRVWHSGPQPGAHLTFRAAYCRLAHLLLGKGAGARPGGGFGGRAAVAANRRDWIGYVSRCIRPHMCLTFSRGRAVPCILPWRPPHPRTRCLRRAYEVPSGLEAPHDMVLLPAPLQLTGSGGATPAVQAGLKPMGACRARLACNP